MLTMIGKRLMFAIPSLIGVVIVTFLALLELIRIRVVRVFQSETFGAILVSRAFSAVAEGELVEESEWKNL